MTKHSKGEKGAPLRVTRGRDPSSWVTPGSDVDTYLREQVSFSDTPSPDSLKRVRVTSLKDGSTVGVVEVGLKGDYYLSPILRKVVDEKWTDIQRSAVGNSDPLKGIDSAVAYSRARQQWVGWNLYGRVYIKDGDPLGRELSPLYLPETEEDARKLVYAEWKGCVDSLDDVKLQGDCFIIHTKPSVQLPPYNMEAVYTQSVRSKMKRLPGVPVGQWAVGGDISPALAVSWYVTYVMR